MAKGSKDALSDAWLRKLKNRPTIATIVVFAVIVGGFANFTDAIGKLRALFQSDTYPESVKPVYRGSEHAQASTPDNLQTLNKTVKQGSEKSTSQEIVNSPGAIQAGRDVIISPGLPQ